jgi:hypothetical protein
VNAEDPRSAGQREHVRGDRAGQPIADLAAGEAPEKPLARRADHDGEAERDDLLEPAQKLEVVLGRLAEPDAGVEVDALLRHALPDREGDALLQVCLDV